MKLNYKLSIIFFILCILKIQGQVDTLTNRLPKDLTKINGFGKPEPKIFSIDEKTGSINGANFLHIIKRDIENDSNAKALNEINIKNILVKIKKIGKIKENLNGGEFSPNGKYFISGKETEEGIFNLMFFNNKGILLNSYTFDTPLIAGTDFNDEGTFYMVWGKFTGDFYFFNLNGHVFKKGNFNKLTGDPNNSYKRPNISKTGAIWLLSNHECYIYKNDNLKGKILNNHASKIDEINGKIIIATRKRIYVYDYLNRRMDFISNIINCQGLNIEMGKLNIFNNDKKYSYEINF